MMRQNQPLPTPQLVYPLEGYGFPTASEKLLDWGYVRERMQAARTYWLCTLSPNGLPHARPVWGVWVNDTLYFGGGSGTRWFRNLQKNNLASVHLDDGEQAVIFEGTAVLLADDMIMNRLDDAYEEKYNIRHGPPIWQFVPTQVFAWRSMDSVTKFLFD